MRHLILLSAFIIAAFTTQAQRYADLKVILELPKTGDTTELDDPFPILANIKNNGPDTVRATDSMAFELSIDSGIIQFNLGSGFIPYFPLTGNELVPGDSSDAGINFAFSTGWDTGLVEICVRVYFLDVEDTLADTIMTNNKGCGEIRIYEPASVNTVKMFSALSVYPNPAHDIVNFDIQLKEPSDVQVSINDITGRTVLQQHKRITSTSKSTMAIDTRQFAPGMYIYNISAGGDVNRGKIEIR